VTVRLLKRVLRMDSDASGVASPKAGRALRRTALALSCASLAFSAPLSAYATAMPASALTTARLRRPPAWPWRTRSAAR
jgi:hypothetical protein